MLKNAIDISYCQNTPNFQTLKENGVEYVVVKAGQGGLLAEGTCSPFKDPKFDQHMEAWKKAKMPIGFYFFIIAKNKAEAVKNAEYFLKLIEPYKSYCPYVYCDYEVYSTPSMINLPKKEATDICVAFMDRCKKDGYIPVLYTNLDHLYNRLDKSRILGKYKIWMALYGNNKPDIEGMMMWQWGISTVKGLFGSVDCNELYLDDATKAVMSIAAKGGIVSPAYWIQKIGRLKYIGDLYKKVDKRYSTFGARYKKLDNAIAKLVKDGVIEAPDYWKQKCKTVSNLDHLLMAFAGGK